MPIDFFEGQRQVHTWGARIGAFLGSTVYKRTLGSCAVLALYVVLGHLLINYFEVRFSIAYTEVAVLGAALSVLLVLRTNSAYDRWWEGRKLWGQLVNDSRNLALKFAVAEADASQRKLAAELIAAFPVVLRDHLRCGPSDATLAALPVKVPQDISHLPAFVSKQLFALAREMREQNRVTELEHHLIDQHITALMNICGACERIRNTPLPLSHRALVPQLLVVYLVVVPLGLKPTATTTLVEFVAAYFLIGLELVAEEIEEPFGLDSDDLPLDTISGNIARSVHEILQ